ncbi:unnamed protein product [Penicillium camemberti]|uniref:Str. FM013 n=1 Tax=Penicillium camemberti (strain FM 013) TaxID=1429867 RepID=A0A0G4PS54_PENC3|nr:unnamed protein product [Penicillium camemberti]
MSTFTVKAFSSATAGDATDPRFVDDIKATRYAEPPRSDLNISTLPLIDSSNS